MVGNLRELIPAFFVGPGGRPLSEEEIARRRQVAGSLLAQATDTSPTAGGGASVLAKAIQGLSYGINEGRADRAAAANAEASQANIAAMLGGSGAAPSASAFPPAPSAGAVAALTGGAPDVASARVDQAHGNPSAPTGGWLRYANQGATRNLPVADNLKQAMSFLPEIGVTMEVYSGGQPGKGSGGKRVGSTRHDHGNAADVRFYRDGKQLDWSNEADRPVFQQIVQRARAAGVTGFGAGPGYMGAGTMHIGYGAPGVWGAGGRSANAPDWLKQAYNTPYKAELNSAVAANEALATGQLQGGLTPAALNSGAEQNYAPGAIDRSVLAPVAAPSSEVLVAESPEDIAAAELAMNDPAFAGPQGVLAANGRPMIQNPDGTVSTEESITITDPRINGGAPTNIPSIWGGRRTASEDEAIEEALRSGQAFDAFPSIDAAVAAAQDRSNMLGRSVPPAPIVAPQVAQVLTALPVNEVLPMAGGVDNPRPIVPTAPQNPMQGLNPAVVQALSNPNATPQERAIAQSLLQQHVAQNQALQAQAQEAQQRAEMLAQRRGLAGRMGIDPNYAVDDTIWKSATEANFRDPASYSAGSYIMGRDGQLTQVPLNPTGDMQEYEYSLANPGFGPFQQGQRRAGAPQTTIDLGGKKFDEEFAKLDAQALGEVAVSGLSAQRNLGRIDQLETLLAAAPSGTEARFKQMAGEWGIPTEGLSEIQAAQALINSLVPEQRPAGSGPMSDADLELFKQSLPRVINQPGGNATIINTMRAIAQYDAEGAAIVQQLRAGDINRQEAFQMLQSRQNPLANFKAAPKQDGSSSADGWTYLPNGVKIRTKGAN